jgi:hypothetical protein
MINHGFARYYKTSRKGFLTDFSQVFFTYKMNSAKTESLGTKGLPFRDAFLATEEYLGGRVQKWTGRDLNPRLPRCERGDHTRLIYRPLFGFAGEKHRCERI